MQCSDNICKRGQLPFPAFFVFARRENNVTACGKYISTTVEPLNKRHFGANSFVPCREVVSPYLGGKIIH